MKAQGMLVAWVAVVVIICVGLLVELRTWHDLAMRGRTVRSEAQRLVGERQRQETALQREMSSQAAVLRDLHWSPDQTDPSAFLRSLADTAQAAEVKIVGVGPLERRVSAQFTRAWHSVEIVAPFRELTALAHRLESEGAILKDVTVELPRDAGPGAVRTADLHAALKVTTLHVSPQAKAVLQRALQTSQGQSATALGSPLPPPMAAMSDGSARDPFEFKLPLISPTTGAGRPDPASESAPINVEGIVKFPGGYLAVVNDRIVKVGDVVSGHHVEGITETGVLLRQGQGPLRVVPLRGARW
jgi:hypothetical protein